MLAVNEIEHSPFTDPVVIKTREEAPIESPQNLQAQSGEMGEIIITWQVIYHFFFSSNLSITLATILY